MKNLKMFEGFEATNENTKAGSLKAGLDSVFQELDILSYLIDEGYLDNNGNLEEGVTYVEANELLAKEKGQRDYFDSDDSIAAWLLDLMENTRAFGEKFAK